MEPLNKQQVEQLVEDWCADLESGEHKQGNCYLCSINEYGEKCYCCLGRLEVILKEKYNAPITIENDPIQSSVFNFIFAGGYRSSIYLDSAAVTFCGISSGNGHFHDNQHNYLSKLNDDDVPFGEIANIIRKNKKSLFPILNED